MLRTICIGKWGNCIKPSCVFQKDGFFSSILQIATFWCHFFFKHLKITKKHQITMWKVSSGHTSWRDSNSVQQQFNWRWRSLSENSHSVLPEVIYSGGVALNMINGSLQKILQTATFYLLFLRLWPRLRKLNLHIFTQFLDFMVVLYFHQLKN